MRLKRFLPLRGAGAFVLLPLFLLALQLAVYATHGGPHAFYTYWDIGSDPNIIGVDPHETLDDVEGLTVHVGDPTMVTGMSQGLLPEKREDSNEQD